MVQLGIIILLQKEGIVSSSSELVDFAIALVDFILCYIHFEITGYPCNLIGSQQCDLFLNRTIFCSKSHLFQIASFMF